MKQTISLVRKYTSVKNLIGDLQESAFLDWVLAYDMFAKQQVFD